MGLAVGSSPTPLGWEEAALPAAVEEVKRRAALQKRLALVEMTNHEFLNEKRTRERTTYADGTTITVDLDAKSVEINPDVKIAQ